MPLFRRQARCVSYGIRESRMVLICTACNAGSQTNNLRSGFRSSGSSAVVTHQGTRVHLLRQIGSSAKVRHATSRGVGTLLQTHLQGHTNYCRVEKLSQSPISSTKYSMIYVYIARILLVGTNWSLLHVHVRTCFNDLSYLSADLHLAIRFQHRSTQLTGYRPNLRRRHRQAPRPS